MLTTLHPPGYAVGELESNVTFDHLYMPYPEEVRAFGSAWCGPDRYTHATDALVARYVAPEESDGQTVEVYGCALPARFYRLRVLPKIGYGDRPMPGYALGTGGSKAEWAAETAALIADGMVGLHEDDTTPEDVERRERAELARLLAKYPDVVGGKEKS